jgi:hypothetical protein
MNASTRTHEKEDPISVFLPAFDHLVVFFLCSLGIYGEEWPRAVTEVRFPLQRPIQCRLREVAVAICGRYFEISDDRSNLRVTYLGRSHPRVLGE